MVNGSKIAVRIEEAPGRGRSRATLGLPQEVDRLAMRQATTEARQTLEEAVVVLAMATHRALTSAQRLDEALAGLGQTGGGDEPVGVALSRREQEVLALVAEGYSNKAIARTLFISPNTVKTHVASLLTKLRADSRVQLATMATRQDVQLSVASRVLIDPVPIAGSHSRR